MDDKDFKKLGDLIEIKVKEGNRLHGLRLENIEHNVKMIYARLEKIDDKQDAELLDIHNLQEDVKALGDKIDANVDTTKRQISEIREELNLPSAP